MAAVKTPEERGPLAAWLYESRLEVDLSPEAVVDRLGRYDAGTIRKADSDSKNVSRPLWRALTKLYLEVAQEKGKVLAPAPLMGGAESGDPGTTLPGSPDLVSLVHSLVAELQADRALIRELLELVRPTVARAEENSARIARLEVAVLRLDPSLAGAGASSTPPAPHQTTG